jgi:hypothetical protein
VGFTLTLSPKWGCDNKPNPIKKLKIIKGKNNKE